MESVPESSTHVAGDQSRAAAYGNEKTDENEPPKEVECVVEGMGE